MKTYTELVADLQEYVETTKPLKERFYNFISDNQCADIPGVPEYRITDIEGIDSCGDYGVPTPVPVERYQLDFQYYLPMHPREDNDSAPAIPLGIVYQTITYDYEYNTVYEFIIPEAYMENPDAWEADVLKRIEARERLAALVMKTILPELPPLEPNSAYYTTDDVSPWSYRGKPCLHLIISIPGVEASHDEEDEDEEWHSLSVDLLTGEVQYEGDQNDTAINIHSILVKNGYNFAVTTHHTGQEYVELNPGT